MARQKKTDVKAIKKVEPIALEMGKPIEGKSFKGETFEMFQTTHGIVFKVYGGYAIFVTPNNIALYETLNDLIENQETYAKYTGEDRENFELNLSAITYVLNVPLFAFSNAEFTFKMAEEVVKFLQSTFETAMNEPLKEETKEDVAKNIEFEEAMRGIEHLQDALKEELKD